MDNWKPSGPSQPLVTAAVAVVLAWTTSLVIISHGVFYGAGDVDDTNVAIIGLAKLSVAVPIVLTGVSFVAAQRDWHSRIVWGAAGIQLLYSCILLLLFFPVLEVCLLFVLSAYFLFRTAGSIVRNRKLEAGDPLLPLAPGHGCQGELEIFNIDVTAFGQAIAQRNPSLVAQFLRVKTPSRTKRALHRAYYECDAPCMGGTVHTSRFAVGARFFKHHTYHMYGTHEFEHGPWRGTATTGAYWQTGPLVDDNISTGGLLSQIGDELITDITEEQMDAIERAARGH